MNFRRLAPLGLMLLWDCSAPKPPEPTRQEILDGFHQLFYDGPSTWHESRWLGIETLQNPNDVWITQEIIVEVAPDFIIETGTRRGGSACLWAMIQREVNPEGKVITIDINPVEEPVTRLAVWRERVEFRQTSSVDPDLVAELAERVRGKTVLVILDSDHRENHVYQELKAYGPMVSLGSYLVAQDTNVNGHPVLPDYGPGPMEAVERFLSETDVFQVDPSRERLLFTMHPRGYLKRVK